MPSLLRKKIHISFPHYFKLYFSEILANFCTIENEKNEKIENDCKPCLPTLIKKGGFYPENIEIHNQCGKWSLEGRQLTVF